MDGLINFQKRTQLGAVINEIKQYQIEYVTRNIEQTVIYLL